MVSRGVRWNSNVKAYEVPGHQSRGDGVLRQYIFWWRYSKCPDCGSRILKRPSHILVHALACALHDRFDTSVDEAMTTLAGQLTEEAKVTFPRDPGETPGESENSWGPGLMPDPNLEPPHMEDQLRAAHRTNRHSDDPAYTETYDNEQ